jgi:hypothetical protein
MKVLGLDIGQSFKFDNFKKSFKLTWLYIGMGLAMFLLFVFLSGFVPQRSFFYYFLQNVGVFLAFTAVLAAYAGVYRITTFPEGSTKVTRQSISHTARRFHYILGLSLALIILFMIIVFLEVGITAISYIPYAGPAITTLLTIPLFLVNFTCLILAVCLFVIAPPLVGESQDMKEVVTELRMLLRSKWINIVLYMIISLAILFLTMQVIYLLTRYTVGITKAAQWKIQFAYPDMVNKVGARSSISDIITQFVPRGEAMSGAAGLPQGFVMTLKAVIGLGYLAVFTFIASFPLAAYFNISSEYFKSIWKDTKKEMSSPEGGSGK